jgi:hypothetical protein
MGNILTEIEPAVFITRGGVLMRSGAQGDPDTDGDLWARDENS